MSRDMFDVNTEQLNGLAQDLKQLKDKGYPIAVKESLNETVVVGRRVAVDIVNKKFVTRNTFTTRSIQFEKVKTLDVNRQEAVLGSTQEYMETQEFGGLLTTGGKHGRPIPTGTATGEGDHAFPRRKVPRAANRRRNIRLSNKKRINVNSRGLRNKLALEQAAENGDKFIFMDTGRKQGIFKIVRKGRKTKDGRKGMKVRLTWDLTFKTMKIDKKPWLRPAAAIASAQTPVFFQKAIIRQLKRRNLFTGRRSR